METPSGVRWPEAAEEPPRRRGIPTWLWVSAGGCLGFVVLLILGSGWLVARFAKRAVDPRAQWAAIREVIAVDEPPPPYGVFGLPRIQGMKSWGMVNTEGGQVMLYHLRGEKAARMKAELRGSDFSQVWGSRLDPDVPPESGTIVVQGRTLHSVRCRFLEDEQKSEESKDPIDIRFGPPRTRSPSGTGWKLVGSAMLVDLSPEGSEECLGLIFLRPDGDARIDDAQVVDFLKPFHVGPER
jgi:hypothetical protein